MKNSLLASIITLLTFVVSANASVSFSYDAGDGGDTTDPQSQGWTRFESADTNVTEQPINNATGLNAWNITDNSTGSGKKIHYEKLLNETDLALAIQNGWIMSAKVRHLDNFGAGAATYIQFGDANQKRFLVWFYLTADGALQAKLNGSGGGTFQITNSDGAANYHDYIVIYNPISESATFSVDNLIHTQDWIGETSSYSPIGGIRFGSGSSSNKGSTNYNYVALESLAGRFTIEQTDSDTNVSEDGQVDSYLVSLAQQPTSDVTLKISWDHEQLTINNNISGMIELILTDSNYQNIEFNVTAVDDSVKEGSHSSTITHELLSNDIYFDGYVNFINAKIIDNDVDFEIIQSDGKTEITEALGDSDTYTIKLCKQPTAPVTINIQPLTLTGIPTNVDLGNGPGMGIDLYFTLGNWQEKQTITITAINDNAYPTVGGIILSHGFESEDAIYDGQEYNLSISVIENDYRHALSSLEQIDISAKNEFQVIVAKEEGQYLGQPDSVLLDDGQTIIVGYPLGHGHPGTILNKSTDGGLTWSGRLPTPDDYLDDHYAPVLHRLTDPDGKERINIMVVTPYVKQSFSQDNGLTWSPFERVYDSSYSGLGSRGCAPPKNMIAIDNTLGKYLAMYHDCSAKLCQIITEDGGLTWTKPALVANHPSYPGAYPCEPGLIRSPDGKAIIALCRENSRKYNSLITITFDEGRTWSDLVEMPASLTGDRHNPIYTPDGRIYCPFRNRPTDNSEPTWGDFVAWVGTYQDLLEGHPGQYQIRLLDNLSGADCGYNGLEILPDGNLVTITYGQWEPGVPNYILSTRFKIEAMDYLFNGKPYCGQPGTIYLKGDINKDCYIDLQDFAIIAIHWLTI